MSNMIEINTIHALFGIVRHSLPQLAKKVVLYIRYHSS